MRKEAKTLFVNVIFVLIILVFVSFIVKANTSGSLGEVKLVISDDTDSENRFSLLNVTFNANFTNSTNSSLNTTFDNSNCQIRFNVSSSYNVYSNMTYNDTLFLYTYNRSFNRKGDHHFEVNCTAGQGNLSLNESFTIKNSAPTISKDAGGVFIDFDANTLNDDYWLCTEDSLCIYNFSSNVTDYDTNDVLTYTVSSTNTTLTNYTLEAVSGLLEINITLDQESGVRQIRLEVADNELGSDSAILRINTTGVNDAPTFNNMTNISFNISENFHFFRNASDEENNIPFSYNITFFNCTVAPWSTRDCGTEDGRRLFNINDSSIFSFDETAGWINISFIPTRNDVGDYELVFNITDLNNNVTPYNATTSYYINFTVKNINSPPYFRYICDLERNATEDAEHTCYINATDIDETINITYGANYTWFTFNQTNTHFLGVLTDSSTDFNSSALVNFTAGDAQVGNWSVNITINDTGSPQGQNSTVIYFFISNKNDSATLDDIDHVVAFSSNNYTVLVNATDNDLLIPDESVYNESLSFGTNHSAVNVTYAEISGTNKTRATLIINPNDFGNGNHSVNITVWDANNWTLVSKTFHINVSTNTPPSWVDNTLTNFTLNENATFYLNLTLNVTDAEGNQISFNYSSDTTFPSFSIIQNIINMTVNDSDVGQHILIINATDGITPTPLQFNFTIINFNDEPNITTITGNDVTITNSNSPFNMNTSEDSVMDLFVTIKDDDFNIPSTSEIISVSVSIEGPNTTLLDFIEDSSFPANGVTRFDAEDIQIVKKDVGDYNITLNASDSSGASKTIIFNLTIAERAHPPNITKTLNTNSSILEVFYSDLNATDTEDINESAPDSNLTFKIQNLTGVSGLLINEFPINSSTGVLNFTFNQTYAGILQFNVSVNDSAGSLNSHLFNITVYDYPLIQVPSSLNSFFLVENSTTQLNFTANHTVGDNLNYSLYINGILNNRTFASGNGSDFFWNITTNFTQETTCIVSANLTLNLSNQKLSNSTSWSITINHTNYPLDYFANISDKSGSNPQTVTLSNSFNDFDATDNCNNQTIGFLVTTINGGGITVTTTNWTVGVTPTIEFSATSNSEGNYSVTAYEYTNESYDSVILSNKSSNNFTISIETATTTTTSPSAGGGGSSEAYPISLKIIVPEPVSAKQKDRLLIPLSIVNDGGVDLNEIILDGVVAKDGLLRTDLIASFDISFIDELEVGERQPVILIVDIDTSSTGLFEVTINGTVRRPEYADWAKFFIEIEEEDDIIEKIIFTEEFIIGNPECAELLEILEEAKNLLYNGNSIDASLKADEALEACKRAITQPPSSRVFDRVGGGFITYTTIGSLVAIMLGIGYYYFKRIRVRRVLRGYDKNLNNKVNTQINRKEDQWQPK